MNKKVKIYNPVILSILFVACFTVVALAIPNNAQAQVDTFYHGDVSIGGYADIVTWPVYEQIAGNQAITKGRLTFDATGIDDHIGSSEYGKLNLVGMYDAAQGADMNSRSYWMQLRKNHSQYTGVLPQLTVKGRMSCRWFDGASSSGHSPPWNPAVTYNFVWEWDDTNTTVTVTGSDGMNLSFASAMPRPFAALQHEIYFGSSPASIAYEAEPAEYSNISLQVFEYSGPKELNGERCNEEEDPYDDPDNPYDTCACFNLNDVNAEPPCEDQPPKGNPKEAAILDQFLFTFNTSFMQWLWDLGSMFEEFGETDKELKPEPDINIEVAPPAPEYKEDAAGIAATMNYRTKSTNLYFAWCLVDTKLEGSSESEIAYSVNNLVAGGKKLPQHDFDTAASWLGGGCCTPLTRTPEEGDDVDNDGMSDEWEMLHFAGITVEGVTLPTQKEQLLPLVNPGDDIDQDGYVADKFKNEDGDRLTGTPFLYAQVAGEYQTFRPGDDEQLTNIEEYILDTDPLNGDTDGDGYSDEMDYIGVGQMQFNFIIEKEAGIYGFYDLSATAVGISQNKKSSIVNAKHRLFIGGDGDLQIALMSDRTTMPKDDSYPTKIYVSLANADDSENELSYEWYFNGESVCEMEGLSQLCDVGQSQFIIGENGIPYNSIPQPGGNDTEYTFKVLVSSESNSGQSEASLSLPLTDALTLTTDACGGQEGEITELTAGSSDIVDVCISELQAVDPSALALYNFIWSVNGQVDNVSSGLGKAEYPLSAVGKEAGEEVELMVRVKEALDVQDEIIAQTTFDVLGPTVEIFEPAHRFEYSDDIANESASRFVTVEPGNEITFFASFEHFLSSVGYEVSWSIDGQEIQQNLVEDDEDSFSYFVPQSAQLGEIYTVTVDAQSFDTYNPESDSDVIKIVVGQSGALAGEGQGLFDNMAAAFTHIPDVFQEILKYAAIFAVVFFFLVYVYPKFVRYSSRNKK